MDSKRILCIEDNPSSRLLIRKILERKGYEVFEADNGIQGIGMARRIQPDLILMDINIPGMDGYESTTRIKGIPQLKDTLVIALTAQTGQGDRERSLIAGCDGYLTKPIVARDLLNKIEGYLTGVRETVHSPVEKSYLKEYSHRLVNRLEGKIHELGEKNKELQDYGQKMENVYIGIISSLMNALEQKDLYTAGHSARVTQHAVSIGRLMGLTSGELRTLTRAGELHDVGKLIIDLTSINKTAQLTEMEWKRMKEHPTIGAHILSPLVFLEKVVPIVEHHHERWDGKGYPSGLSGKELGLQTCIISVADSYDAMTTARSYRQGFHHRDEIIGEISRCSGTQFDPVVADVMIRLLSDGEIS